MTSRVSLLVFFSLWGPLGYGGPPNPIAAEGRLLPSTCVPSALVGDQQKLQQRKPRQQQKKPLPGAAVHLSLRNSSSNPFITATKCRSTDSGPTSLRESQRRISKALLLPVGFALFLVFLLITFRYPKPPKSALRDVESRFSSKGRSTLSRTSSTISGRDPHIGSSNSRAMEEAEASPPAASFALQHLLRRAGSPTAQHRLIDWAPIRFRVAGFPVSLRARQVDLRSDKEAQVSKYMDKRVCNYSSMDMSYVRKPYVFHRSLCTRGSPSSASFLSHFCPLLLRACRALAMATVSSCPSPLPSG